MTWSYSGDPSSSNKDAVRFLVGDNITTNPLVQDEEINYVLGIWSNPLIAAGKVARSLAARFAGMVDKSVGDLKIAYSKRLKNFLDLAEALEMQAAKAGGTITLYSGGVSISDKKTVDQDTDRMQPVFRKKQFENHGQIGGNSGNEQAELDDELNDFV